MDLIQMIEAENRLVKNCLDDKQHAQLLLSRIEKRAKDDAKIVMEMWPEVFKACAKKD